jgi:hypothetical protein
MGVKSLAVLAVACAAALVAPCQAQELRAPMTTFFMEFPLDARSAREQRPNFGLQLQGSRAYQSLRVDRRMFELLPALAGIEATWIVAGAVGVVAVAALAGKDKATSEQLEEDRQQQREACPVTCAPK